MTSHSDTLAARHLAALRAAAVRDRTLHDAVEWVSEMVSIVELCEFCGLPLEACDCIDCYNCGEPTDEPPRSDGTIVCATCREDLQ